MLAPINHHPFAKGPYLPRLGTARNNWIGNVPYQVSQQWLDYGANGANPLHTDLSRMLSPAHPVHTQSGAVNPQTELMPVRETDGYDHPARNPYEPIIEFSTVKRPLTSHLATNADVIKSQQRNGDNKLLMLGAVVVGAYFLFVRNQ